MSNLVPNRSHSPFSLRKSDKLCSIREIEELFKDGSSFYFHPFRIKYITNVNNNTSSKVLFSVPKRRFKRAVDRNWIKRRLREAYRLHQSALQNYCAEKNIALNLSFIYCDNNKLPFEILENKLILSLHRLIKELEK